MRSRADLLTECLQDLRIMGKIYTVDQINSYIRRMLDTDTLLENVSVSGEVSNCKYYGSGHIYFTIKENSCALSAVMFSGNRGGLDFKLETGMKVVVTGNVSVYERDGKYQLYARKIEKQGTGALYEKFLELRKKLDEMGMFSEIYKKPIPKYAHVIGVVTAETGAVIHDIINVATRRNPYVQIVLCPARVQGEGAAESICRGIRKMDAYGADVIIVGRGGGSIEDLWAFNEESVAQAVFECNTPVISAVGHEVDYTITDFVADLRAPTPSAAAELAVFDISAVEKRLSEAVSRLGRDMSDIVAIRRDRLSQYYSMRLKYLSPMNMVNVRRQHIDELYDRMSLLIRGRIENAHNRLSVLCARLEALSPLARFTGGYAYVTDSDGRSITTVDSVKNGDEIKVNLKDGVLRADVSDIRKTERTIK